MPWNVAIVVLALAIAGVALMTEPRRRSRKLGGSLFEAVGTALADGHYARTLEVGELALQAFKKHSEPWLLTHWMMGQAAGMIADSAAAQRHLAAVRSALDTEAGASLDVESHLVSRWLGIVALMRHEYNRAAGLLERSLREGESAGGRAFTLRLLALVEASRERFDEAHRLLRESRQHAAGPLDDFGHDAIIGGAVLLPQGRFDEALDHLARAEQGYLELGEVVDAGQARAYRGQVVLERGEPAEAVRLLREALGFVRTRSDNAAGQILVLPRLAMAEIATGDLASARQRIRRARELNEIVQSPETEARIRWASGRVAVAEDRYSEARGLLTEAARGFAAIDKRTVAREVDAELRALPQ